MSVRSILVALLTLTISILVYTNWFANSYTSLVQSPDKEYDYIIVGAGTAGCVVAARLAQSGATVLLLEAGAAGAPLAAAVPVAAPLAQGTSADWELRTIPQRYSSFGMWNRQQKLPRGKLLGGSGRINYLMHGFGTPDDLDSWAKDLGLSNWSYADLEPFFLKAFGTTSSEFDSTDCTDPVCANASYTSECLPLFPSTNGAPMKLVMGREGELARAFRAASRLRGEGGQRFRRAAATVRQGRRWSTFEGYLQPALARPNLHVLVDTLALKIRFEGRVARGVYLLRGGRHLQHVWARREVVACAGAVGTPHLLLRSGIGPERELRARGVPVVARSARVGRGLHDHVSAPLYASIARPVSTTLAKLFAPGAAISYLWHRQGPLSFPPIAGSELVNNDTALILLALGSTPERLLRDISNYKPEVFRRTFPFYGWRGGAGGAGSAGGSSSVEGLVWVASCVRPRSRGRVSLGPPPRLVPRVDPRYLAHPRDVTCLLNGLKRAHELSISVPFRRLGTKIHWPIPERCAHLAADANYTAARQRFYTHTSHTSHGNDRTISKTNLKDAGSTNKDFTYASDDVISIEMLLRNYHETKDLGQNKSDNENGSNRGLLDKLGDDNDEDNINRRENNEDEMDVRDNDDDERDVTDVDSALPSDEYLECVVREVAVTGHHLAGTASLGAVLDQDLRVLGVRGLRVADASVLPAPISLYPASVLVGVAERAAHLILTHLEDLHHSSETTNAKET